MKNLNLLRTILLYTCSILFGIGAWITINGVWVEVPQLVLHQPEGWALSSYITIIAQTANIGPIAYSIVHRLIKSTFTEVVTVITIAGAGSAACLLLSFFWNEIIYFAGQLRSVPLFVLVFLMALVDCTSTVVYLPFMATFKDKYLTSFIVGEGLSGFLSSILVLIQGVEGSPECISLNTTLTPSINNQTRTIKTELKPVYPHPRFSAGHFFLLLFAMDALSLLAFLLLNYLPLFKCEKRVCLEQTKGQQVNNVKCALNNESSNLIKSYCLNSTVRHYLYVLEGWLSFLGYGVTSAIPTYSCLPYGNTTFTLAITLSMMAHPLASCIAYFYPIKKISIVSVLAALATLISCYIMVTAVLSPNPPLVNSTIGKVLIVVAWILFHGFFYNAKTNIAGILHKEGKRALFWYGACTQIGATVGAVLMFVLINTYELFKPCN